MLRSLLAATLLLAPAPTATASVEQTVISPDAIVQVICKATNGYYAGTAFRVGNGLLLSVNHVTSSTNACTINDVPISISYKSPTADFSMLNGSKGPFLTVDCGGFIAGHHYLAIGYARGLPFLTTVELVATGETDDSNGEAILAGIFAVVPGMSGGAIISEDTGKVVGTVNAENFEHGWSWSVALSDTPVCRGNIA